MRIVVACKGRAHLLDCCRELQKHGHKVTFFTATPRKNFKKYGLGKGGVSFVEVLAPLIILSRCLPSNFTRALFSYAIDILVCVFMPKCEVFIGASPDFTWAMKLARRRFKAKIILDRGASHVRIYNEMSMLSGQPSMTEWYMTLDESQYQLADYIALGSDYMKEGFISKGVPAEKLFSNPYGVMLKDFNPTKWTGEYDFIYVGRWSKRKGCNIIVEVLTGSEYSFLHVGALDDMEFPSHNNFTHIDPVPQQELIKYYAKAKTFLFPSYDDGFGMVLCQAAACGLQIIASSNCGSTTMVRLMTDSSHVQVMKTLSVISLKEEIGKSERITCSDVNVLRDYNMESLKAFSWAAYGDRLDNFLKDVNE